MWFKREASRVILALALVVFLSVPAAGSVLYVDDDAAAGGDGTSWNTAYRFLQDALLDASTGDRIWVAQGVYYPDQGAGQTQGAVSATFQLVDFVSVLGGFAGDETEEDERDPDRNETVLSGDIGVPGDDSDNSTRVVLVDSVDEAAVLDGFTITGGRAESDGGGMRGGGDPTVINCRFIDNQAGDDGGAVFSSGRPTFVDCTFLENSSGDQGGAVWCSTASFVGCVFECNDSQKGGAVFVDGGGTSFIDCSFINNAAAVEGGGVSLYNDIIFERCTFLNNATPGSGGGICGFGVSPSDTTVIDCAFIGNTAGDGAGAIANAQGGTSEYYGCRFIGNVGTFGGGLADGGNTTIVNCLFSGNFASATGGGFTNDFGTLVVTNSTFSANSAMEGGGGIFVTAGDIAVTNCILWGNDVNDVQDEAAQLESTIPIALNYSCVQGLTGQYDGTGNIGDDPLFNDPDGADDVPGTEDDDLRIPSGSPCVDAGDNEAVPPDQFDFDEDSNTLEPLPFDLDGNARFSDDTDTKDTGNGSAPVVDMGAYEFDGGPPPGTYTGPRGGSWFDPTNWQGGQVPDASTDVFLSTTVVIDRDGATANSVTIEAGGRLIVRDGSLSTLTLLVRSAGTLTLTEPAAYVEVQTLTSLAGSTVQWDAGTIRLLKGGDWMSVAIPINVGCAGSAMLVVEVDASVTAPMIIICELGAVAGRGALVADVTNAGLVTPGASLGQLTINGSYTQTSTGTLFIELGGYLLGSEYDAIIVSGQADVDGTLDVALLPGFQPELANVQNLINTIDLKGSFEEVNLPSLPSPFVFDLQYGIPSNRNPVVGLLTTLTSTGPRLFVDADAPPGGDAQSWETATNDLQGALQLAPWFPDDITEVWVAAGTYRPDRRTGDRTTSFGLSIDALAVYGGFAGWETRLEQRDIEANVTVLTGDLAENDGPDFENNGENSCHVVLIEQQGQQQRLDGFTITGGNANDPDDVFNRNGGGLRNNANDLTVSQCRFVENFATLQAGGMSDGGHFTVVSNCEFIGNRTNQRAGAFSGGTNVQVIDTLFESNQSGDGGAAFVGSNADPVFTRCIFRTNVGGNGGGLYAADTGRSIVSLIDCVFEGNSSTNSAVHSRPGNRLIVTGCLFVDNSGGGIRSAGFVSLDNCVLLRNDGKGGVKVGGSAQEVVFVARNSTFIGNSTLGHGGGVDAATGMSIIYNCSFVGNSAVANGGAVYASSQARLRLSGLTLIGNVASRGGGVFNASPSIDSIITNCTFYLNQALVEGGGIFNDPTSAVVANSILWNNFDAGGTDESAQIHGGTPFVNFTCIQGLTGDLGGLGNIGDDPLFVDPDGADDLPGNEDDDLRLQIGSPCIDAAFNNAVPADLADVDDDDDTDEFIPLDLDGNPRFADAAGTPDTGCGVPVVVDMGAYEFIGEAIQPRRGDTNGDLIVGALDLLVLLTSWGPCADCCLADFNADGIVGAEDLLILLVNWG